MPKEFRFDEDEVVIKRIGHVVMLLPRRYAVEDLRALLGDIGPLGISRRQPRRT